MTEPASSKKPRGRPPHVPTAKTRDQVKKMVAAGLAEPDIARIIGISHPTLAKHYGHEIAIGLPDANAKVSANLFRQATKNDIRAAQPAIAWLKMRAGWSEKPVQHEIMGPNAGPIQTVNVTSTIQAQPGETPAELYDRLIRQSPIADVDGSDG